MMTMLPSYDLSDDELYAWIRDWTDMRAARDLFILIRNNWDMQFGSVDEMQLSDDVSTWVFVTGGWSDNEALIEALAQNTTFWNLFWEQSNRGGRYCFSSYPINEN
jgi:hypothetical protein